MAPPITRAEAIAALTAPGMPHALVDATALGRRVRVFANGPATLRALYEATATALPFLAYEDERLTFAQAWAAASRIGHVLVHDCGVRPGDRVAIAMRNYPEWVLAFNAITSIGAVAVAMNGHWQADELLYGLQDSGATVVLADAERLARLVQPQVRAALPQLQCLAVRTAELPPGTRSLQALVNAVDGAARDTATDAATDATRDAAQGAAQAAAGHVPMPPADIAPDDFATILYTSGSTGHPKGVVSTHRNILSALLSWELDRLVAERVAGLEPPAVPPPQAGTLLAVPLFHVSGLNASFLSCYRMQRRMVTMYRWDAALAAELIDRERLTSLIAPAAMTGDLVRVAQQKHYSLATLLTLGGGGAPRAPEQVRQIGATFAQALPNTGWGMTETNAIGAGIGGEDYLARPASAGRCAPVLELRIVDETGQALPARQRGELLVRGTSVFPGYWNQPEANARSFVDGDWFRTGDVAYLDDEGFLFIVDRIKDLIIRGGENIGCGQVEAALLLHPQVHEAAVYAVPDERMGEEVGATVHGAPGLDVQALRTFLAQHLARFEIPRFIEVAAEPLPRTPSGKILKRQIQQTALAALQGSAPP